jgi:general L-amino acid transport system permease protein
MPVPLLVGVLNTLKVSFIGIVLTVLLGTIVGISRLSSNWLVSRLAAIYIEVLQDIPVLLQLFFWYAFFTKCCPRRVRRSTPSPAFLYATAV